MTDAVVHPGVRTRFKNCMCGAYQDAASGHATTWFSASVDNGDVDPVYNLLAKQAGAPVPDQSKAGVILIQALACGPKDQLLWQSDPITVNSEGSWGPVDVSQWVGQNPGPFDLVVVNQGPSTVRAHAHIQSN